MKKSNLVFEQLSLSDMTDSIKMYVIDYARHHKPEVAEGLAEAVNNNGELINLMIEAQAAYLNERIMQLNSEANELFRKTVRTSEGIDRLVSNMGIKRGVLEPATDDKPAVMESDADLLARYDLSFYAYATTGTRLGYKFHAMSFGMGNQPTITIAKEPSKVIMTYTFNETDNTNISDIEFRRTVGSLDSNGLEIGTGQVVGAYTPSAKKAPHIDALLAYMRSQQVSQETDTLTLKEATAREYTLAVIAYTNNDPQYTVDAVELERLCYEEAARKRKNAAYVSDHDFSHIAKSLGAYDVDIKGLETPLVCNWDEYAQLTTLNVSVKGYR